MAIYNYFHLYYVYMLFFLYYIAAFLALEQQSRDKKNRLLVHMKESDYALTCWKIMNELFNRSMLD